MTNRIRKLRQERGISQENVADELGITHSAYAKIERGETDPNLSRLFDLAKIFNIGITDFFTEEKAITSLSEPQENYGGSSKEDIEKLNQLILKLLSEIDNLRAELAAKGKPSSSRKK